MKIIKIFRLLTPEVSPGILRHIRPLCLQFFPLCLMSCHYAFSSSPYALCLATMPSVLPPMPYVLPLCLQFFLLCLMSCHYAFSSSPMPYILPLCLQFFPLCIMSCPYAFSSSPYVHYWWLASSHLRTLIIIGPLSNMMVMVLPLCLQ